MGRVGLSPRALADLDDIWLHVAQDDPPAAHRLVDRIVARCQDLAVFPQLGPAHPEIDPGVRMLVVGDYLALYRVEGDDVEILRVTHGARRLVRLFGLEK